MTLQNTVEMQLTIPSLEALCQEVLADEAAKYGSKKINELCKRVPSHLLEPILQSLLGRNQVTDVALSMFLVPSRTKLVMNGFVKIKNSTFKQIGYSCPNLVSKLILILLNQLQYCADTSVYHFSHFFFPTKLTLNLPAVTESLGLCAIK